jgi:hypothetical protein
MLKSITQLYGHKLGASDGDIGQVKDFYFDDRNWVVRYVVADTGSWLSGRKVLLSPHAFGSLHREGNTLLVALTRKQIEDSPSIDSHKPVSRQFEEEYYRHYGWPFYWQGDALWGMSGFPILELPSEPPPRESSSAKEPPSQLAADHLRSTKAVHGYNVDASDGTIGHVCDFMVADRSWAIEQLLIKTGHRLSGTEVAIPTGKVERISWDQSTVFVSLTKEAILYGPGRTPALIGADLKPGG